jgi:hypothetical protein
MQGPLKESNCCQFTVLTTFSRLTLFRYKITSNDGLVWNILTQVTYHKDLSVSKIRLAEFVAMRTLSLLTKLTVQQSVDVSCKVT